MALLTKDNFKTVTDLREQTINVLNSLSRKRGPTFILRHAEPKAVLLSFQAYQNLVGILENYLDEELALKLAKEPKKKGPTLEELARELNIKL